MIYFLLVQIFSTDSQDDSSYKLKIDCSIIRDGEIIIPQYVTEIYGEDSLLQKCKHLIKSIRFAEDSKINKTDSYIFSYSSIESADFSDCKKLTYLDAGLFFGCEKLKSVIFPPNVVHIYGSCFEGNKNLISIDLPDSVVTLGYGVFSYSGLATINISRNSKLEKIDQSCFGSTYITSIFIPKFVNSISSWAFTNCQFLDNITVDPENTYYKNDSTSVYSGTDNSTLFKVFTSYMGEYIIPSFIIGISDYCFNCCKNITSIQTHNSISSIKYGAFYECTSLTNIILPPEVTVISRSTFGSCTNLTNVTFTGNIIYIERSAFLNCISLTKITIPESVESIESSAFYNCISLTNITLPPKVTEILQSTFGSCTNLTNVTFTGKITFIESYAFFYCISLTNITIPESVRSIGIEAFSNCISLTNITIPESVRYIGERAFSNCISLTNITLPPKVTVISWFTFNSCTNLTNVTFTGNITSIGESAFSNCISLTHITIPESVQSIGINAFYNCISLANIKIPESVKSIGRGAFYNCISLTDIIFPPEVTEILSYTFYNCTNLTNVIFTGKITFIGESVFSNCTNIKNIKFLNNINTVRFAENIFGGIENRINIYIPGDFNISSIYSRIVPKESHLYITNETILSESCKIFFGEKSVHVHFNDVFEISDETTNDVINYIVIDIYVSFGMHKSIKDKIYYQAKCFHLVSLIHSIT